MAVLSNRAPGQPAGNGLGPDTTRSSFTRYDPTACGPVPATAGGAVPAISSTPASSAGPARKTLGLSARPLRPAFPTEGSIPAPLSAAGVTPPRPAAGTVGAPSRVPGAGGAVAGA